MKQVLRFLALAALICVPWVTQAQTFTVYESDGTEYNEYVPFQGYNADGAQHNQMIYPATDLSSDMVGKVITKMVFYIQSWGTSGTTQGNWTVSLGETEATTLSGLDNTTPLTQVYYGQMEYNSEHTTMTITFDDGYTYNGGNLLVDFNHAAAGWHRINFYGKTVTGASYSYSSQRNFLNKITFTYETPASCAKPTGLAANATADEASLSWTANGGETEWTLYWKEVSATDFTEVPNVTDNPYTLDHLTAQTDYQYYVVANCSSTEQSNPSSVFSFTTPCDDKTVPYSYNFEDVGEFACWNPIAGTAIAASYPHGGSNSLKFSSTTNNIIALPAFNTPTNTLQIEFWTRPESNTYSNCGNFAVGYMTDLTDVSTFTAVETYAYNDWTANSYEKKTVNLDAAPINAYIAFRQYNNSSSYYWFVDDVTVRVIPNCLPPTALYTTPATDEAELSWTANSSETAWTLYWKEASATDFTEVTGVTENPYTLDGLTPATTYQFKVVANCSSTDASVASDEYVFQTLCEPIAALGYTENFDSYTTGNNVLPVCWNYINTTTYSSYQGYPKVYNYSANSPSNCLSFSSYYSSWSDYDPQPQYAILPEMTGLAGKQVTLQAKGSSATSTFKIGTMSNPAGTFTPITEQELTTSYQEFSYNIPTTCTDAYLAIMIDAATSSRTSNGVYIDDISIANPPTCNKPTGLAKSNVAARQVDLSWTMGNDESAWQISVNDGAAEDMTGADVSGSTVTYTLTGLDPETEYTVKVRANCGGSNGVSEWSNVVSFTTTVACPAPTSPSVLNSSITAHTAKFTWIGSNATPNYVVSYRTAAYTEGFEENFNSSSMPTDWTRYSGLVDQVIAGTATLTSGTSWTTTSYALGSYNAKLNIFGENCKHWLVTPEISIESGYSFSFDLALTGYNSSSAASGSCADDRFVVLIYADDSWTILREWNNSGSGYVYNNIATDGEPVNDIDISGYVGKTVKFAFYGESTASGGDNDLHIDNVAVGIAHATGTWQTVDVDDSGDDTPAAEKVLTGLAAETKYEAKVKANCTASSDGYSLETSIVSFTTLAGNQKPTNVEVDPVTLSSNTATVSWTGNGCSDHHVSYDVYYATSDVAEVPATPAAPNLITGVTETSKTITGLAPNTEYMVWVRDNCGTDGVSDWTASDNPFTTLTACPQPTGVTVSNIGTHMADMEWTGIPEYTVMYRTSAYMDGIEETFGTSIPSGWENKTGLLSDVMGGTALASGSQWNFGTGNGVFDNHAKINIYGSSTSERKGWLITPTINLTADATLRFDMALTYWQGTDVPAPQTTGVDDRFVVLISTDNETTWTILREWNNSGSTYVYNNIANTAVGENVSIDLSAYAGNSVRIAFYGESTESNADNYLHIDNVIIGTPVPAGSWLTIEDVDANSITLTGLDAGTKYDVVIEPECNTTLASDPVSFTTVALPTLDITANSWYAIASPVHNSGNDETVAGVDNLIATSPVEYDFLRYVEASCKWESYKQHTADFDLEQGRGYIYRRSADATLVFDGEPNRGNVNVNITMDADGWNLVGNPYMKKITRNSNFAGSSTAVFTTGGYRLSANGTWTAIYNTSDISVGEAVLLKATTAGTLTINAPVGAKKSASNDEDYSTIAFTVSNDEFTDIAYARFSSEEGLPKISHLNPEAPMLSIDGYAIANLNEGTESFPMSFSGQGSYTLTVSGNTDITGYLHLVDRLTGRDIDLLSTPSYSFTGSPVNDRFTVKLTPDANEGSSTSRFAIFDGNSLVISGEGTLEVYDVMGRRLMSAEVTGSEYRIPGSDLHTGVYVLRMNGMSQKIVIK